MPDDHRNVGAFVYGRCDGRDDKKKQSRNLKLRQQGKSGTGDGGRRFGGHIVSGHIDGTGVITEYTREENAIWVTITCDKKLLKYIIEKGSITIDGISLTVAYVDDRCFKVSIIPHTAEETTLIRRQTGAVVNLENDVIGKYVDKLLHFKDKEEPDAGKKVDMNFLAENGFL
jgi:riboflavin synthase